MGGVGGRLEGARGRGVGLREVVKVEHVAKSFARAILDTKSAENIMLKYM